MWKTQVLCYNNYMPELPEVETIRRGLKPFILHRKIVKTDILCDKSFMGQPTTGTVINIRRFGKALIIDLDDHQSLMIHLRMTGQLIYDPADHKTTDRYAAGHPSDNFTAKLPNKQTRVILHFNNGTLYFNDQRKFGFIKVIDTSEVPHDPFIKKLAHEPWQMPEADFYDKLMHHANSSIKATILDQTVICGLGNIYADEALFSAKIHPLRKCGTLSKAEVSSLLKAACTVMNQSIASGGSTMATYVKADGTKGDYLQKFAKVFRRDGEPCPVCGTKIVKIRVAGRGTHICPNCQPNPANPQAGAGQSSEKLSPKPSKKKGTRK